MEPFRSPLADYHVSQGATLGNYRGAIVPARFSDPIAEHIAVRAAVGLFDGSFRSKFALTGRDNVKFLHRIVSNDVKKLASGQGVYTTLLNPKGQILVDMYVYAADSRVLVDVDADLRSKAMEALRRYIIGDQVQIEPLDLSSVGFAGPQARALLEKTLHVELPPLKQLEHFASNYAGFPVRVVSRSETGEEGYEVWVGPKGMMGLWGAACGQAPTYGMLACGSEALETLRIEAGVPRYGRELGEDTLPLEAGLLNALSFTKGCYIGQEIVERARSRGHVNWKLVGVVVDARKPLEPGEKLMIDGQEAGEITSSSISPTLGKVLALAYVRQERSEPGTKLIAVSGPAAEVKSLPFYQRNDAGLAH